MSIEINLDTLEGKINIIKNIDNEYCRYIESVYNNYKICIANYNNNMNLIKQIEKSNEVLEKENVVISSKSDNIFDIIKTIDSKKKLLIFCFDDSEFNIENYKKILDQNVKNKLIIVENYIKQAKFEQIDRVKVIAMSKMKIKKILLEEKPDNIFICINADKLENDISWESNIKNNLETILFNFDNINIEEISNNPIDICKKCYEMRYNKKLIIAKSNNYMLEDLIKLMISMKYICEKNNIEFGLNYDNNLVIANVIKANKNNEKIISELMQLIEILMCKSKREMYERIYDNLCDYLDNDCKKYNYCNFENNKCIAQRDSSNKTGYPVNEWNGCCFDVDKRLECNKIQNKTCTIKCISCKLFICRYLRDRGIVYPTNKNLQIKCFLNIIQRPVFVWNFFKPKEEIISKLWKGKK